MSEDRSSSNNHNIGASNTRDSVSVSQTLALRKKDSIMDQQQHQGDIDIDWFNFETKIRNVIFEVIEPITKKQFATYDTIDEIKKLHVIIANKYDDTHLKLDKLTKRNDVLDKLDKLTRDLVNYYFFYFKQDCELQNVKALQKNDIQQILEKLETINTRWKVTQNDVNDFHRYDEKIKNVQKAMQDVTDQYKQSVTQRFKDMSQEFMRSIHQMDQSHRDLKSDMQEVMIKVQSVKEFTQGNDLKFKHLNTMIEELRETIENSRFPFTYGGKQSLSENAFHGDGGVSFRQQVNKMQEELSEIRKSNLQIDNILRPSQEFDPKEVEKIILKNQIQMFEQIFGQNQNLKKLSDYQNTNIQNYLDWRSQYEHIFQNDTIKEEDEKPLFDDIHWPKYESIKDKEDQLSQAKSLKKVPFWKIYALNQHQNNSDLHRNFKNQKVSQGGSSNGHVSLAKEFSEMGMFNVDRRSTKYKQQDALAVREYLKEQRDVMSEKKVNKQIALEINQNSLNLGSIEEQQINNDSNKIELFGHSQIITARISNQDKSIDTYQKQELILKRQGDEISQKQELNVADFEEGQDNIQEEQEDNEVKSQVNIDESFDEGEFQLIMKKILLHPQFVSQDEFNEKIFKLQEIFQDQELKYENKLIDLQQFIESKYNHNKINETIQSFREQLEVMGRDLKFIRNNEHNHELVTRISKTESNMNYFKNDLQQQIYKLKEFDEQLYLKQIETGEQFDLEIIKIKRERSDLHLAQDKNQKDFQNLRQEDSKLQEQIMNLACLMTNLIEVNIVETTIGSQFDPYIMPQGGVFKMPTINMNGQLFALNHLWNAIKVMIESSWNQMISKQPFNQIQSKSNLMEFNINLVSRLSELCAEYQRSEELKLKQQEILARGLPKEILRIKETYDGKQIKSTRKVEIGESSRDVLNLTADNNDLADYGVIDLPINVKRGNHNKIQNQSLLKKYNNNKSQSPKNLSRAKILESKEKLILMPEINPNRKSRNMLYASANEQLNQSISPIEMKNKLSIEQIGQRDLSNIRSTHIQQPSRQYNSTLMNFNNNLNLGNLELPKQKIPIKASKILEKATNAYSSIHSYTNQHQQSLPKSVSKMNRQFERNLSKEEDSLMLIPINQFNPTSNLLHQNQLQIHDRNERNIQQKTNQISSMRKFNRGVQ
ncbi:UNKNOWN [Stylonychia lemnae]|uniref:Uncharacterized protein n=1 Tax=Stylonychia lemnae TaxID=5949 RepID=A0A078ANP6_STYLE|nr:UNKNOWN [Stylonychia lemnae]|eukprot:CDW82927.1 UNKNOWN [Stylonychia lemnae]